jgi:hypothetical protein
MIFIDVVNPYGTDAFAAPTSTNVKPHKLAKVKKGTNVLRCPKAPSTILRNILLTW